MLNLAIAVKAIAILLAGDIFNEKKGVPTSLLFEVALWASKARKAGIVVLAIPGNHDLQNDRYDSLPLQPLGVLFESGLIEDVSFKARRFAGTNVMVTGIPYPAAMDIKMYDKLPKPGEGEKSIIMAHCFATMSGGQYFQEPILAYPELCDYPYDIFHFGHDHQDNGVKRIGDRFFINLGALARGSISIENISRDVKCALVEIGNDKPTKVTQVKLQFKPASEVFDLVLRAQKQRDAAEIEAFVGTLSSELEDVTKDVDFKQKVLSLDIPEKVKDKVNEYIQEAEAQG